MGILPTLNISGSTRQKARVPHRDEKRRSHLLHTKRVVATDEEGFSFDPVKSLYCKEVWPWDNWHHQTASNMLANHWHNIDCRRHCHSNLHREYICHTWVVEWGTCRHEREGWMRQFGEEGSNYGVRRNLIFNSLAACSLNRNNMDIHSCNIWYQDKPCSKLDEWVKIGTQVFSLDNLHHRLENSTAANRWRSMTCQEHTCNNYTRVVQYRTWVAKWDTMHWMHFNSMCRKGLVD